MAEAQLRAAIPDEPPTTVRSRLAAAGGTWVPAVLLIGLAVSSSLWLASLGEQGVITRRFEGRAPDLTMEEFEVTSMGEDGSPRHRLTAAYLAHFVGTGTKELTHPHLVIYEEDAEPWHVASERGWVSADNDVLKLLGKVNIWRNRPDGRPEIRIETEDLQVLPREEYAETALPVRISTPESLTRGTGMRAYLAESRVELLADVRTRIEPIRR